MAGVETPPSLDTSLAAIGLTILATHRHRGRGAGGPTDPSTSRASAGYEVVTGRTFAPGDIIAESVGSTWAHLNHAPADARFDALVLAEVLTPKTPASDAVAFVVACNPPSAYTVPPPPPGSMAPSTTVLDDAAMHFATAAFCLATPVLNVKGVAPEPPADPTTPSEDMGEEDSAGAGAGAGAGSSSSSSLGKDRDKDDDAKLVWDVHPHAEADDDVATARTKHKDKDASDASGGIMDAFRNLAAAMDKESGADKWRDMLQTATFDPVLACVPLAPAGKSANCARIAYVRAGPDGTPVVVSLLVATDTIFTKTPLKALTFFEVSTRARGGEPLVGLEEWLAKAVATHCPEVQPWVGPPAPFSGLGTERPLEDLVRIWKYLHFKVGALLAAASMPEDKYTAGAGLLRSTEPLLRSTRISRFNTWIKFESFTKKDWSEYSQAHLHNLPELCKALEQLTAEVGDDEKHLPALREAQAATVSQYMYVAGCSVGIFARDGTLTVAPSVPPLGFESVSKLQFTVETEGKAWARVPDSV